MVTSKDMVKHGLKKYGEFVMRYGTEGYKDLPRVPTGIFALDIATGGGIPCGKVSMVYGPESGNKTNTVLRTIAEGQKKWPDRIAVFIDAESTLDTVWAQTLGVDLERLIVIEPEFAEQAADILIGFLETSDVFMVCLDSVPALLTNNEIESSVEKASVGGSSLIVTKMIKKAANLLNKNSHTNKLPPALFLINQVRTKIGVTHGATTTYPGGAGLRHACSLVIRQYAKNILEKSIHAAMPAHKEVNCVLEKWKFPILASSAAYTMQMIHGAGNSPGYINDWNTLYKYMQDLDFIAKVEKKGYSFNGHTYPTLGEVRKLIYDDPQTLISLKESLIKDMLESGGIEPMEDEDGKDSESAE